MSYCMRNKIEIIPIDNIPIINPGDDLGKIIVNSIKKKE